MASNIKSDSSNMFIVNTVLGFIKHGLNVGTETNTIKVEHTTFSLQEIKCARKSIWDWAGLGTPPVRVTFVHRSQVRPFSLTLWRSLRSSMVKMNPR